MLVRILRLAVAAGLAAVLVLAGRSLLAKPPARSGAPGGRLAPCPKRPNCVSSQADDAGHRVEPFAAPEGAQRRLDRLAALIEATPRARVVERGDTYLRAEYTSRLFRFVDDLELAADEAAGVVHVRSASRVGRSDLGANRRRVEALRETAGS